MARTKEREVAALSNNKICNANDISVYMTAIYVRISSEDERKIESKSVENQIAMLNEFVNGHEDMKLYKCYCDRGISGTTFDRPEFRKMMEDMKKGKFQCIVVKDLSRLGRNFIETCEYIETIFPLFGIRFVSVTDRFDTLHPKLTEDGLVVPLKNLFNEAYVKDISKKICAATERRQKNGIFIGKVSPYGYRKSEENKGLLVPDSETMGVVQRIFKMRADGMSVSRIVKTLNAENIISPMQYRYMKGLDKTDKYAGVTWSPNMVTSMLRNPVYIGDMEQGYQKQCFYKGISAHRQDKSQYIYVEGTHEPIVEKELYYKVQELLDEQYKKSKGVQDKYKGLSKREDIFKGLLYCADCDVKLVLYRKTMKINTGLKTYYTYHCKRTSFYNDGRCVPKNFKMEKLEGIVSELLKAHISLYEEKEALIRKLNSLPASIRIYDECADKRRNLISALELIQNRNTNIYNDFADGLMDENEYLLLRQEYLKERKELENELAKVDVTLEEYSTEYNADAKMRKAVNEYGTFKELTPAVIQAFIKKIVFYDKKRIEVFYIFADVFAKMDHVIEDRRLLEDEAG